MGYQYGIDGLFLTQKITGIQRYAYEIVTELDKIVPRGKVCIVVPESTIYIPSYENILTVKWGKHKDLIWQQTDLPRYLRKNKLQGIFLTNILPLLYPYGLITIHDVCYRANPQFYRSMRDRLSMYWHRLQYWWAAHSDVQILTVSGFSKSEIMHYYGVSEKRITIIYNAWQHIERVKASQDTFEHYSMLQPGKYFFSMSTLGANKNFKWILHAAKNNPQETFAIAGGGKLKGAAEAEGLSSLPNICFLGYVSDEDAKVLMANCKAFLFPTLYEGFGIPPLEAVACGCKIIILSDTLCMHEIYGEYANYINPLDYEFTDFDNCAKKVERSFLSRYAWGISAQSLLENLIK